MEIVKLILFILDIALPITFLALLGSKILSKADEIYIFAMMFVFIILYVILICVQFFVVTSNV